MKTTELVSKLTEKEAICVFGGFIDPDYPRPGFPLDPTGGSNGFPMSYEEWMKWFKEGTMYW